MVETTLSIMGMISGIFGAVAWYESKILKKYTAQAEFSKLSEIIVGLHVSVENIEKKIGALQDLLLDRLCKSDESPSQLLRRMEGKN
jgi:hypothetical protein